MGVTVNLAEGTAHGGFAAVYDSDGKVLRSGTFTSIESLWGSQDDAMLIGDSKNNLFDSHAGDDVLESRGGADRLFGGGGGNGGNDTASYAHSSGSDGEPDADRRTGGHEQPHATGDMLTDIENLRRNVHADTLASIENPTGSAHGDTLTGNAAANVLIGGARCDRASYTRAGQG